MMERILLLRDKMSDDGSFGTIVTPFFTVTGNPWACQTLELPWLDNEPCFSCIPEGVYPCIWYMSRNFGGVYLVQNVDGRSGILTHSGNLAGNRKLGRKSHSLGCILLGKYRAFFKEVGQMGVALSKPTCNEFFQKMNRRPFELDIRNNWRS